MKTSEYVHWINPLLKILERTPAVATTRRVPDGTRVYCVGDIHGRDDLLGEMAELVAADIQTSSFDYAVTVFLGDYIDRGLGSMRVVDRLARSEWPTAIIALAGNHEDLLLAFLEDERVLEAWRGLGGLETLHSYGVNVESAMVGRDFKTIRAKFAAALPQHHRRFFKTLKASTVIGNYFFCHAGVRPGTPLNRQGRKDLLNIREPFLCSNEEYGKLIVHGHTPSVTPAIRPNRIGIDIAPCATERLTCLVLERHDQRFLNVGRARLGNPLP
jgi:serine/threonine protein phosphatase 1